MGSSLRVRITSCRSHCLLAGLILAALLLGWTQTAAAWWYHATRRAAARSILAKGVNPAKVRAGSRFGPGLYLSRQPSTALAEKGARSTVLRFQGSRALESRTLDLRRPTPRNLKSQRGDVDLRGTVKKGVIGPKLGQQLGRKAGHRGQAIQYRSARTRASNLVIPKKVLQEHPNLVRPLCVR